MKLKRSHKYLLSLLGGLLMIVSFPHTGSLFPLAFIAWIPLLLVEHSLHVEKSKIRNIFIYAFLTFVIYGIGTSYWLVETKGIIMASSFIFLISGTAMAICFTLFHGVKRILGKNFGGLALLPFWIGYEYLHYHWEMSWPWLNLGNLFSVAPEVIQWYSVTGVLGGTLWILWVNYILTKVVVSIWFDKKKAKTQIKRMVFVAALLIIPISVSLWMYATYKETKNPLEVVITQPNVDTYTEKFNTDEEGLIKQLDLFLDQAEELMTPNTSVVISPETVISIPFYADNYDKSNTFNHLQNRVNEWDGVDLVTGAATFLYFKHKTRPSIKPVPEKDYFYELYDDLVLIRKDAAPVFIHKSELVLGAEKVPFSKWFPFLENYAYQTGDGIGTLGTELYPRVVSAKEYIFAPVICYESAYGWRLAEQARKRAEVIFIITNDGWWGDSPGHKQHNSLARLRAIETRKYVARSANSGISCIINQKGDIVAATRYNHYEGLRGTVQLNKKTTFYSQYGDFIGMGAIYILLALLPLLVIIIVYNRSKQKKEWYEIKP